MFSVTGNRIESQPSTFSIESPQPCRPFKFPEILIATENFEESLVIGRGGFGKVYQGNIMNGSTVSVVAIKRLDPMSSQGASEFWAEVEMLSNFRHSHVVSLFGYCNHEKEMILIYEYMANGTLEDHLHKLGTPLSWLQRLKICIGAARGLDYLHTGTGTNVGVIHRDVKTSNILLDESFAAKVSDFGLSKVGPTNQSTTHVNTRVKGTFGYLDPEYSFTGMLTRKSDVYAFGVVLLEVLCRKPAVDWDLGEEPRNLARWALESIKEGNLKNIIDSSIRDEISPKCLKEFVGIVKRCLLSNQKQRPMMAEVVVSLNSVLTIQEKANTSLQATSKTIFGKMLDVFPSPSNREDSAHGDSKVSSKGNNSNTSFKVFKFADIKRATRNFSQDLAMGEGISRRRFLGWVDKNTFAPSREGLGIAVTVEMHDCYDEDLLEEWQTKLTILGGLTHPNIVSFLGYCDDKQHECIIVYEYTHHQTLHHFLFGAGAGEPLTWGTRVKIITGVARALTYMHSLKDQVIHLDVNPSNILLDQDFIAKLGGFGTTMFSSGIREEYVYPHTLGYLDPEYLRTCRWSLGSDIYSFGVVLLETLTGQRNGRNGLELIRWARRFVAERDEIMRIMDPRLEQNYCAEDALDLARLALRCVAFITEARPTSAEVLRSLELIYAHGDSNLSSIRHSGDTCLKVFKFSDLERATSHFSQDSLLDIDGCREVFLGWVDKNTYAPSSEGVGIGVTVKRYNGDLYEELLQESQTEVTILRRLIHPNIIRLLGFCNHKHPQRLNVYEYVGIKSLSHFLYGDAADNAKPLLWGTRVKIMIGVAHALAYMHMPNSQIIHRDVKSSNILLDQDFNAKLGGFGMARFGSKTGRADVTARVMGTVGYVDPEYISTGRLSVKSDVYSFGVVLLETLTGQQAYDMKRLDDDRNLITWASPFLAERSELEKILDPRLIYIQKGVFECATLALKCVANNRTDRPSSEELVRCLEQIYFDNKLWRDT